MPLWGMHIIVLVKLAYILVFGSRKKGEINYEVVDADFEVSSLDTALCWHLVEMKSLAHQVAEWYVWLYWISVVFGTAETLDSDCAYCHLCYLITLGL